MEWRYIYSSETDSVSLESIHVTLISWGRSICSSFCSCKQPDKISNVAFTSLIPTLLRYCEWPYQPGRPGWHPTAPARRFGVPWNLVLAKIAMGEFRTAEVARRDAYAPVCRLKLLSIQSYRQHGAPRGHTGSMCLKTNAIEIWKRSELRRGQCKKAMRSTLRTSRVVHYGPCQVVHHFSLVASSFRSRPL